MKKKDSTGNLELMKVRRIYDLYLSQGVEYESALLDCAVGDSPPYLRDYARALIAKLSERGEGSDERLISELLGLMVRDLKPPFTRARAVALQDYFRFSAVTFAGFLGNRHSRGLEIVASSWRNVLDRTSGRGALKTMFKVFVPILARAVFAAEAARLIRRSEKLPGEIGPVIDLNSARAFFKRAEGAKGKILSFLDYCEPKSGVYSDFAAEVDGLIGKDDPFAYNIGTGAFLVQGSLNFQNSYYLLEKLFQSEDPVRKYEAHRVLMYILEAWPEPFLPEQLTEEAVLWTEDVLYFHRRIGEPQALRLDYSYPISQLCLILSLKTVEAERRAMEFMNGWLAGFVASSSTGEKVFVIRGLKQYQQMFGKFLAPATAQILDLAVTDGGDPEGAEVAKVALTALRELTARFPEECTELLKAVAGERDIPGLTEIRAAGERDLPRHTGYSVSLSRFFQNILVYGGDVRAILLDLVGRMARARSLESYLSYLGQWFLNRRNLDVLVAATRTVEKNSQVAPDLSLLPPVLEYLDRKHESQGK